VDLTGTFKYSKTELLRDGYNPDACADQLYFDTSESVVPLDRDLYERIQAGEFRL
jgi:fatty-acyl-CoA synthase